MVKRSIRERLKDIAAAIEKIDRFVSGQTFDGFSSNALIHDAVVRNFEIISEASRHIPKDLKDTAPQIEWREIADFGNLLRHGYEGVNDRILWDTIRRDLPELLGVIKNLLADPGIE